MLPTIKYFRDDNQAYNFFREKSDDCGEVEMATAVVRNRSTTCHVLSCGSKAPVDHVDNWRMFPDSIGLFLLRISEANIRPERPKNE